MKRCAPTVAVATGLAMIVPGAAWANDSTAEFATGGLRFKKDADIAMQAEDLFVSTRQVRVAYTFLNRSSSDKTVMIAFPMPDIVATEDDEDIAVPTENADNLFGFAVTADGAPVPLHLDIHALAKNVDQTARLRALGIPLMPLALKTNEALDKLPKATRDEFVRLGLGRIETFGTGGPMQDHLVASWTLRTAFTWMQSFPAGRAIKLVQTYQPSVGGSAQTFIGADGWRNLPDAKVYAAKYCLDDSLTGRLERARAARHLDAPPFGEQRIAYVLETGANWAGPIGDFHLTIDKGDAKNLVSFCADGVRKTGPTRFEVEHRDFTPTRDLFILILSPLS